MMVIRESNTQGVQRTNDETGIIGQQRDEQIGCRQRLEAHLSCPPCLALAVA